MTFLDDITKPFANLASGFGGALNNLSGGASDAMRAVGQGYSGMMGGVGKLFSSPMTIIVLIIAGVVAIKFF